MEDNSEGSGQQMIKYEAEADYSEEYLQQTQNPERYNEMTLLHDGVKSGFDDFVDKNEKEYGYLRSIDVHRARVGDEIMIIGVKGTGIIQSIKDGKYTIKAGNEVHTATNQTLRPCDDLISKLKTIDISNMYTHIRNMLDIRLYSEIDYFFVFSEYFKINERTLYFALPVNIQSIIMQELNQRTNALKKKGIQPIF